VASRAGVIGVAAVESRSKATADLGRYVCQPGAAANKGDRLAGFKGPLGNRLRLGRGGGKEGQGDDCGATRIIRPDGIYFLKVHDSEKF
jgi:hypothetical protein